MGSGRSSRRRRQRISGLSRALFGAVVLAGLPWVAPHAQVQAAQDTQAPGASAGVSADADAGAALIDEFLETVESLEARFEQHITNTEGEVVERGSGMLWLQRPSRFRWRYDEPFEQVIVADGKNLWMHDIDLDTYTVTPLDDAVASTPAMLLGGDRTVRDHFRVLDRFTEDGLAWVVLAPVDEGTDFRSVLIAFDGAVPARLEFLDGLNHTTHLTLHDIEVNERIPVRTFRFSPPRGAAVIGTPAD